MAARRIVIDPSIHFGQPILEGTRIPVWCVLELVQAGMPFSKIVADYYPDLTEEDVQGCVRYATELIKSEEIHIAS